jgi:hypothetical protein
MRRLVSLLPLFLLVACGDAEEPAEQSANATGAGTKDAPVAAILAEGAERIECAMAGVETFASACTVERRQSQEGLTLILRAPNGSFRRLLVTKDGRGVVAADGAVPAIVTPVGPNRIDVEIAGDRYRLPATVRQ